MDYVNNRARGARSRRSSLNLFLLQIYAYCFFDELVFIYNLYALMFVDHGLSVLQISTLFVAWSVTGLILEIPSGTLADRCSREHILLVAQVTKLSGFAVWMVWPCFLGFLAGFVLWGSAGALCSGTFESLVYDELKQFGQAKAYGKLIGRAGSISTMAVLVSSVCASPMAGLGYRFVISISLVSLALSCVPLLFLRSVRASGPVREIGYFSLLREGVGEAVRSSAIRSPMVFICFALMLGALDEFWPLMGRHAGLANHIIPLFMALNCVADAAGCAVAHRFEHLPLRAFYSAYLLAGVLLLATAILMRPAALLLIPVFTFLLKVCSIVFEARLQHAIRGSARATVLSVKGFFTEAGAIPVFLGLGLAASNYGCRGGFGIFACIMLLVGLIYLALGCRSKPTAAQPTSPSTRAASTSSSESTMRSAAASDSLD